MGDLSRQLAARFEASLGPLMPDLLSADPASKEPCEAALDLSGPQTFDTTINALLSMAGGRSRVFDRVKVFLAEPAACRAPKDPHTQVLTLITAVTNQQLRALLASIEARLSDNSGTDTPPVEKTVLDSLKSLARLFGRVSFLGHQVFAPRSTEFPVTGLPAAGLVLLILRCEALKLRLLLATGIGRRLPGPVLPNFSAFCPFLPSRLFCSIRSATTIPTSPSSHPLGPRTFAPVLLELDSLLERCCAGLALPRCCEVGTNAGLALQDRFLDSKPVALPGIPVEEVLRDRILFRITESVTLVAPFLLLTAARQGITPPFLASPLGTAAIFESREHYLRSLTVRDITSTLRHHYAQEYEWIADKIRISLVTGNCLSDASVAIRDRAAAAQSPGAATPTTAAHSMVLQPWQGTESYPVRRLLGLDHRSAARAAGLVLEAQLLCSRTVATVYNDSTAAQLFLASASGLAMNAVVLGVAPPQLMAEDFYWGLRRSSAACTAVAIDTACRGGDLTEVMDGHLASEDIRCMSEEMLVWLDPKLRQDARRLAIDSDTLPYSAQSSGVVARAVRGLDRVPAVTDLELRRRYILRGLRGNIRGVGAEHFRYLSIWAAEFGPREERVQRCVWRWPKASPHFLIRSLQLLERHTDRIAMADVTTFITILAHSSESLDDIRSLPMPETRCWLLFTDPECGQGIVQTGTPAIAKLVQCAEELPPTLNSLLPVCAYVASLGRTILMALQSPEAAAAAREERREVAQQGRRREKGQAASGRSAGSASPSSSATALKGGALLSKLHEWRRSLRQVSRHLREVVLAAAEAMEDARAVGGGAVALGLAMEVHDQARRSARGEAGTAVGPSACRTREVDEWNGDEVDGFLDKVRSMGEGRTELA